LKKYLLFLMDVKLLSSSVSLLLLGITCFGTVKILCLTFLLKKMSSVTDPKPLCNPCFRERGLRWKSQSLKSEWPARCKYASLLHSL